jgi:type III restriction enzyme
MRVTITARLGLGLDIRAHQGSIHSGSNNIVLTAHRYDRESAMDESFFERPILHSPYAFPARHWKLDADRQPINRIVEARRRCDLITPVPLPRRRRRAPGHPELGLGGDDGRSRPEQQYDVRWIINEIRGCVSAWRDLPNPKQWQVTPDTARQSSSGTKSTVGSRHERASVLINAAW